MGVTSEVTILTIDEIIDPTGSAVDVITGMISVVMDAVIEVTSLTADDSNDSMG